MKQISYLSLLVSFILGFGAATGLFVFKNREQPNYEEALHAKLGASLGKEVAILTYLNEGKTNEAKFILELWLNNDLIAMHSKQGREGLNADEKIFEFAREYRREHPFASTNYGIAGGESVEELVDKIIRK